MAGRCELCDGKIVNGRCVECGMDYTRRQNRYHLNENCDDYDRNARKINDAYEETLRGKDEPQKDKKKKDKTTLNGKASAKPNTQRKDEWAFEKAFPEKKANSRKSPDKNTGKKVSSRVQMAVVLIIGVLLLVGLIGELWENSSVNRADSVTVYSEIVNEQPVYGENLPIMPETGNSVGFDLTAYGCYIAGVDIPAGTYAFINTEDDTIANVSIDQPEYGLYEAYYLDDGECIENVRLYDGAMLQIDAGSVINCVSDNAQTDSMHSWEGKMGEYVVFAAEEGEEFLYTVGEDIAPGRYTVRYQGKGTSVLGIRTETGSFEEYMTLSCEKYSPESTQYLGLVLEDGNEIYIEQYGSDEAWAEFMPLTYPVEGYFQNWDSNRDL